MTQKELLLKDLCSRLPYGVICNTSKGDGHLCSINQTIFGVVYGINIKATERDYFNDREEIIKPYLRPMLSMTEEQLSDLTKFVANGIHDENILYDWYNRNHFDYRGLIEKSLALDATNLGIYE